MKSCKNFTTSSFDKLKEILDARIDEFDQRVEYIKISNGKYHLEAINKIDELKNIEQEMQSHLNKMRKTNDFQKDLEVLARKSINKSDQIQSKLVDLLADFKVSSGN